MTLPSRAPLENPVLPRNEGRTRAARTAAERRPLRGFLAVAFAICGCSLLMDPSDIDAGCPEGWKDCGGCVRIDDPTYGCRPGICGPACALENAEPACTPDGRCIAARCLWGFGCPDSNGCLTPILGDPKNCGDCNLQCPDGWLCQLGECVEPPTEQQ